MDKKTLAWLLERGYSIGITDESVKSNEGTGIVHVAPGCGEEDFKIWMRYLKEVVA